MNIPSGTYIAVATAYRFVITRAGSGAVLVTFQLTEGLLAGVRARWLGSLRDDISRKTLVSLRHCGWSGEDFPRLPGLGGAEVDIAIETEADGDGLLRTAVRAVQAVGTAGVTPHRCASDDEVRGLHEHLARAHKRLMAPPVKGETSDVSLGSASSAVNHE